MDFGFVLFFFEIKKQSLMMFSIIRQDLWPYGTLIRVERV